MSGEGADAFDVEGVGPLVELDHAETLEFGQIQKRLAGELFRGQIVVFVVKIFRNAIVVTLLIFIVV